MGKKISKNMLKIAILAIAIQEIGGGAASPALADIMKSFSTYAPTTVMLIATLPSIATIFVSPIYGKFTEYVKIRTLMMFGFLCFLIGGIAPFFLNSLPLILVMRAIVGVGVGVLLPMQIGLIADFFEGHERDTLNGWTMTVASVGGMVFQLLGGYLTLIDWHYCFLAYIISIPIFIFEIIILPEPERKQAVAKAEKIKLPSKVYYVCLGYLVYTMFLITLVTNVSVFIEAEKLGNAANAGMALTLFTLGSLLAGTIFGKVVQGTKGYNMSVSYLITALGMLICYLAHSVVQVDIGTFVTGVGMGLAIPSYYSRIGEVAPAPAVALSLSFLVASQGLGQFLQPYFFDAILKITQQSIGRQSFFISFVAILILGVLLMVTRLSSKKKTPSIPV